MTRFRSGISATCGQRSSQQDAAAVWPGEATFAWAEMPEAVPDGSAIVVTLADGMGGHAGGAQASQIACRVFIETYAGGPQPQSGALTDADRRVAALDAANSEIARVASGRPELSGMGTTLIGAVFSAEGLTWVSVGDSPLYLCRRGELALLNEDHSLAPALDQLAAEGHITAYAAKHDPRRHMLRSAVTGEEFELVDISKTPLALGRDDVVVLASDGIQTLDDGEIVRVISGYAAEGPKAIAEALVRAVENARHPHQDNATVVVVQPSE